VAGNIEKTPLTCAEIILNFHGLNWRRASKIS
jgi:hypothetical protein